MPGLKPGGGTMSAEMDALAVVNQLRDLAADPLNRRAIVEDQGCLPGLILFLDHPNPQVVYSALLVRHVKFHCVMFMFYMRKEISPSLRSFYYSDVCSNVLLNRRCHYAKIRVLLP